VDFTIIQSWAPITPFAYKALGRRQNRYDVACNVIVQRKWCQIEVSVVDPASMQAVKNETLAEIVRK
jgi:hypothetical protein